MSAKVHPSVLVGSQENSSLGARARQALSSQTGRILVGSGAVVVAYLILPPVLSATLAVIGMGATILWSRTSRTQLTMLALAELTCSGLWMWFSEQVMVHMMYVSTNVPMWSAFVLVFMVATFGFLAAFAYTAYREQRARR